MTFKKWLRKNRTIWAYHSLRCLFVDKKSAKLKKFGNASITLDWYAFFDFSICQKPQQSSGEQESKSPTIQKKEHSCVVYIVCIHVRTILNVSNALLGEKIHCKCIQWTVAFIWFLHIDETTNLWKILLFVLAFYGRIMVITSAYRKLAGLDTAN